MYGHIQNAHKIGLFTHNNPDGDALGSTIGLIGLLQQLGKEYTLYLPTLYGESLNFMVPEKVKQHIVVWKASQKNEIEAGIAECDLLVCMDFGAPDRAGDFANSIIASKALKILVDHHVNPAVEYFDKVYSDPGTSSTCELLYSIMLGMPTIDGDATKMSPLTRESLLTGMTTDTNNFANSTTPGTFKMASELIAAGTDREKIIQNLYFSYPVRRIRAEGFVLSKLMRITKEGVAYILMDRRSQIRFGLKEGDTEGFVNIPLTIKGVRMSILTKRELNSKKIRVSIRSKEGTSARDFAKKYFHGGGHELASGGKLILGEDVRNRTEVARYVEKCIHEFFAEK